MLDNLFGLYVAVQVMTVPFLAANYIDAICAVL
jgi:hypothetical protein